MSGVVSNDFKPQDFSRFLIREFLKKNGFDKTYEQFMLEDDRPKVTMTKNELMRLLGIEALMKKNSTKAKLDTMLDIICDSLVSQKGAETSHSEQQESITTSSTFKMRAGSQMAPQNKEIQSIKAKAQGKKQQPPPQTWFGEAPEEIDNDDGSDGGAEEIMVQQKEKSDKKQSAAAVPIDDDWDLEEEQNAAGYIKMPSRGGAKGSMVVQQQPPPAQSYGMRPATAVPGPKSTAQRSGHITNNDGWMNQVQHQPLPSQSLLSQIKEHPQSAMPRKRVIPKQTTVTNDIDELDDLMGNNNNDYEFGGKKKDEPRDTLGFLKKSEEEKKRKEEERKIAASKKEAAYKMLSEINYNLGGYESDTIYPYSSGPNITAQAKSQTRQQSQVEMISQLESNEIKKLLFKTITANFHDSWHQGFYFDAKIKYGIVQREGGPCGMLAAVQAFYLKHLLYITQTKLTQNVDRDQKDNLLVAALSDILINACSETGKKKLVIVVPSTQNQIPKSPILPNQCQKITLSFNDSSSVFNAIKENISFFTQPDGHGAILLVYSVILTRGIQNILNDMDMKDNSLLTEHGYASQEFINIILVGKATSNVFDGDKDMGDNFILKGIHKQSEIGFLTLFEAYGYFQVGAHLKSPKLPIWIVCSESHYSVLFSTDMTNVKKKQLVFDLIYYDELAKQEDDIILTAKLNQYKGPVDLQKTKEMIPPIDAVIRTKWDMALVSWNGRQIIL